MKPGGSMSHSQGFSNIPSPSRINPNPPINIYLFLILSSHLHLGLRKGLFPVGLSAKLLKAFLPSYNQAT
jgi:hypothetical protein